MTPFQAPNDIVKYTTNELLDISALYTNNEEAVRPLLVPGGRGAAPGRS
jgi:hypothetical protein